MSDLASLLDYIDRSTENLNITLKGIVTSQTLRYDVIYEQFLKTIEQYKINLFSELKLQLIPGFNAEESSNEVGVLQQMKLILNVKIRDCITELNLASTPTRKEEIISHLGILNDSLQKIEKNILESRNLLSPLSQSWMSQNLTVLEEIEHALDNKNKTIITPLPQKKEKVSSDITTKLTPLLSESAENKRLAPFKTPNQYSSGQPNTIPKSVSQITSAPKSDEIHVTNLTSFNKTNEKSEATTTPNQNTKNTNTQSVSLFEMFDNCLNSIVQNKNEGLQSNPPVENTISLRSPVAEKKIEYEPKFQSKANEEKKLRGFFKAMNRVLLRKYLIKWTGLLNKISLPNFDNDFDLLHGNIAGMHELDMPKDHDEFYLKTKDFSLILNKEEIMKDYTQDNLLSTQLSFCDGNMDEMNFEDLGKPRSNKHNQNKPAPQTQELESTNGGDKSSRKIKEPTNFFEDSKSKLAPNLDTRKGSIGSLINQNSSQKIKAIGGGPVKASIAGTGQALTQKAVNENSMSSASKRPSSRVLDDKKAAGEKEKTKSTVRSSSNSRVTTNTTKIPSTKALNSSSKVSAAKENNKVVSPMKSFRLSNYNSTK